MTRKIVDHDAQIPAKVKSQNAAFSSRCKDATSHPIPDRPLSLAHPHYPLSLLYHHIYMLCIQSPVLYISHSLHLFIFSPLLLLPLLYCPFHIFPTITRRRVNLPPESSASTPAQESRRGDVALVLPLLSGGVAAGEVEPGVGLVVVDRVEGVGDGGAIEVAARGAQVVKVEVVGGAAWVVPQFAEQSCQQLSRLTGTLASDSTNSPRK